MNFRKIKITSDGHEYWRLIWPDFSWDWGLASQIQTLDPFQCAEFIESQTAWKEWQKSG